MQYLSANITIKIPDDLILISKSEFQDMKDMSLLGAYWSMKDLEKKVNRKHEWIKENILYPSHFRKILDVENGGFVYFPKTKGQTWSFHATKMTQFLDENFTEIFTSTSKIIN